MKRPPFPFSTRRPKLDHSEVATRDVAKPRHRIYAFPRTGPVRLKLLRKRVESFKKFFDALLVVGVVPALALVPTRGLVCHFHRARTVLERECACVSALVHESTWEAHESAERTFGALDDFTGPHNFAVFK